MISKSVSSASQSPFLSSIFVYFVLPCSSCHLLIHVFVSRPKQKSWFTTVTIYTQTLFSLSGMWEKYPQCISTILTFICHFIDLFRGILRMPIFSHNKDLYPIGVALLIYTPSFTLQTKGAHSLGYRLLIDSSNGLILEFPIVVMCLSKNIILINLQGLHFIFAGIVWSPIPLQPWSTFNFSCPWICSYICGRWLHCCFFPQ